MTSTSSPRPIVQLIDILGKKWVLRILWELNEGSCTFRTLQSRCGDISPTIINTRIKDLCSAQLVNKSPESGYTLTQQGYELIELFYPINDFANRWVTSLAIDNKLP
jgi:DNA-binding HxlR family transcriptional regulator